MLQENIRDFVFHGHKRYLPHISIDCTVFGFHENHLKILLLKWKKIGGWSMPGGYMMHSEEGDVAARRLLKERTGLDNIFLQQFRTFTGLDRFRIPPKGLKDLEEIFGMVIPDDNWLNNRTISIGYYALVEYSQVVDPQPDAMTEICAWCDLDRLPPLLFDHEEMIEQALKALRMNLNHQPIGLNLLPEKFTMTELQALYETILGTKLDRGNFRKKIMGLDILEKTGERPSGKAHKTPHLYSFRLDRYNAALKNGINFNF